MDEKIFIHAGYPKSASTFIQQEVLAKSKEIHLGPQRQGYQKLLTHTNPDPRLFGFDLLGEDTVFSEAVRRRHLARLRELAQSDPRPTVLSNESIAMIFKPFRVQKISPHETILDRIERELPGAQIILVLRPQQDWVLSWYRHLIGGTETRTLEQLLDSRFWTEFVLPRLKYDEAIAELDRRHGAENVHLLLFPKLESEPTTFVRELCEILAIPEPDWQNRVRKRGRARGLVRPRLLANRAYEALARRITQPEFKTETLDPAYQYIWSRTVDRLNHLLPEPTPDNDLTGRIYNRLQRTFEESNRRLEKRVGEPLSPHGFFT